MKTVWRLGVLGCAAFMIVTSQGGWKVQKTTGTEASIGADGLVTIRRTDLAAEGAYGLVTSTPIAVAPGFAYEFGMTCRGTSLLRPDNSFQHGAHACLDLFPLDARRRLVKSEISQGKTRLSTYSSSPDFRTYEGVFRMPRCDGELSAQLRLQLSDRRKDNPSVVEFSDAWIRPADFALSNPGFEDGVNAPADWAPFGAAKCARTDAEHHDGRFAVSVADAPDGELSGWSRLVPVRADRVYTLSGWVKGGELNPDGHVAGGALAVSFLDAERNTVGETSVSPAVPARTDWTHVELKDIHPPRGAVLMRLTAGLRYCRGEAWFDDLDLTMRAVRAEKVAEVVRDPKPSPSVRYATNLLANGDCEAGADGKPAHWHYVGKAEKDWTEEEIAEFVGQGRPKYAIGRGRGFWSSDTVYEGAHALANVSIDPPLTSGGWHGRNPVAGCWVSDPMPCVPGKAYVAGGWIRPGRLINDSWYGPLRLVFRDAKGCVLAPANRNIRAMMEACAPGVWSVWWTAPYVAPKTAATVELEFGQEYNALRGGWGTTYADNLAVWEFAGDVASVPSTRNRPAFPEWFLTTPTEKPPYLPSPRRADEYVSVRGEGANTATANAFYDPSKPVDLAARLFNLIGEDRDLTIEMTRYDEQGREYPIVTSSIALEGYGHGTARMTVPPTGDYGCFFVDCKIREGEATVGAFSMRYAVMPKLTRQWTVENPLTVTLLADPSDELLAAAKAGGFGSLWLHPNGPLGAAIASDYETFDAATASVDRDIALCAKWGLKVIFGIAPKDFFTAKHPRTIDYAAAKRLGSFLGRKYADKVRVFVNWGVEQSNSKSGYRGGIGARVTDEEYDTLMASFYDGIKSAAPQAKVVIGNIATDFNADTVRRMYEGPGKGKFDGAAFNAYMGFGTCMSSMLKVFDAHGDTAFELWSEEQCAQRSPIEGSARRYGELEGAENLVRTWIENLALSCGRLKAITQWGFLRTGATAPDVYMMDRFCQPRPQFVAHAVMSDFLADVVFTADRGRGRTVAYEGSRTGGATVVAAWTVSGETVLRYRSARAVRVTDAMGRVREIAPGADGTVAIPLTRAPVLVDFGGAAEFAGTEEGGFAGVLIRRAAERPAMDGTWTGWNGAPDIAVDETSGHCVKEGRGTETWTGRADASGAFKLVWDEENLYFGMTVTDDAFVPQKGDPAQGTSRNGFMGDAIEIAVQPEGILKESAEHFEWEVFLPDGFTRPIANRRFPLPGLASDTNLVASVTRATTGGDTVYQLAIPWKLLGVTPRPGHPLSLALTLNDKDDPAVVFSGMRVQLNWADGLGAKNPSRYGECRLE